MKVFDKLIHVSKAHFLAAEKVWEVPRKLSKAEFAKIKPFLPTEDEKAFMEILRSNMPQLARLQRKMSVCLDVEVTELSDDRISFKYGEDSYTLTEPKNAYKICPAIEKSKLDALIEMNVQGCVLKNDEAVKDVRDGFRVDELRLLCDVASKFFFQTFLH